MYNLLSLILGLLAWSLGIAALVFPAKNWLRTAAPLSCTAALLLQLVNLRHLVQIEDWSCLLDTIDAVVMAAAVLVITTAVLTLAALRKERH